KVKSLVKSIQAKNPKIHLKGLIGSFDAMVAAAAYTLQERHFIFILPTHEEASYFLSDLESILDKQVLFFPASFRKAYEFTQIDASHVLQRAEALSALNHTSELPKMLVTYPEAIAEKVINRDDLEKNTLSITQQSKLSIDFINEFLYEYDFERVDFVYEPGQFAIRGGIVDIFSFSNDLPYRIEFFGDDIESIRTFDVETQLSVSKIHTVIIVPNVQAKFLSNNHISLLEYIDRNSVVWLKDVQFTLDILKDGYKKAYEFWKALPEKDIQANSEWVDPRVTFTTDRAFGEMLFDFPNIEFGKQFFYKPDQTISFDTHPQPSFNKDFNLLIHNFKENEKQGIQNLIFSDSTKQIERIFTILEDIDKSVTFIPIHRGFREGFRDDEQKLACYTDHQIFDRYYKYKRKKGYERSQAITLKE